MTEEFQTYLSLDNYDGVNPNNWKDCLMKRPAVEHIERYRWVLEDLQKRGDEAWPLLEVGVGCGWGLRQIKNHFNGLSVGIDLNPDALKSGIKSGLNHTIQADLLAKDLPFANDQFSTIVNLVLIEQLSNPLFGLENIGRVTKPGGQMYLSIFNKDLFSPGGKKWFRPNQHEFSKNELTELLERSGWRSVEWLGQRFVSRESYLKTAALLQMVENSLKQNSFLAQDRRIQIFRARVQNIIPSLNPSVKVRRLEEKPNMEPVIFTVRCLKD